MEILSEKTLLDRRYPHTNKTRREWDCNRCGLTVRKGDFIEHSWSKDGKICIELCLPCVEKLKILTLEF